MNGRWGVYQLNSAKMNTFTATCAYTLLLICRPVWGVKSMPSPAPLSHCLGSLPGMPYRSAGRLVGAMAILQVNLYYCQI